MGLLRNVVFCILVLSRSALCTTDESSDSLHNPLDSAVHQAREGNVDIYEAKIAHLTKRLNEVENQLSQMEKSMKKEKQTFESKEAALLSKIDVLNSKLASSGVHEKSYRNKVNSQIEELVSLKKQLRKQSSELNLSGFSKHIYNDYVVPGILYISNTLISWSRIGYDSLIQYYVLFVNHPYVVPILDQSRYYWLVVCDFIRWYIYLPLRSLYQENVYPLYIRYADPWVQTLWNYCEPVVGYIHRKARYCVDMFVPLVSQFMENLLFILSKNEYTAPYAVYLYYLILFLWGFLMLSVLHPIVFSVLNYLWRRLFTAKRKKEKQI